MVARQAKPRPATRRKSPKASNGETSRWSGEVTRKSNALDLEPSVFTMERPRDIALSLKRSAEASKRRKGSAYQSAMSMLTFYINRAGKNLPKARLQKLDRAKAELRKVFGRES